MSKIICDICGTSYLETAKQCPICGSVRPGDVQRVTNEVNSDGKVSTGYTYVKGGRFSKSNVKKRTNGKASTGNNARKPAPKGDKNVETKSNRGLVITAIVLLLAIIGVVIYIALRFFAPISEPNTDSTPGIQQDDSGMPCTAITLDVETVLFEQIGVGKLLEVKTTPEKPLEPVTYRSDNEAVAVVTNKGKITAVAEGTAKITVTCGKISKECIVTVKFPEKPTSEPTQDTTIPQDTTVPNVELRLNRKDITFAYKGESWVLYSGEIAKNLITWTSDDEKIVAFTDGKAVAVGSGMTEVHAEYEGQKVSCIVRCNFTENSGVIGNGGVSEDGGGSVTTVITGYCDCNESINIRSGPGTSYADVGDLYKNEMVTITETQQGSDGYAWGKIGENKWVAMKYIKTN